VKAYRIVFNICMDVESVHGHFFIGGQYVN
jgi:hypothetical protein